MRGGGGGGLGSKLVYNPPGVPRVYYLAPPHCIVYTPLYTPHCIYGLFARSDYISSCILLSSIPKHTFQNSSSFPSHPPVSFLPFPSSTFYSTTFPASSPYPLPFLNRLIPNLPLPNPSFPNPPLSYTLSLFPILFNPFFLLNFPLPNPTFPYLSLPTPFSFNPPLPKL